MSEPPIIAQGGRLPLRVVKLTFMSTRLVRHLLAERSEIVDDHLGRASPDDAVVLEAAEDQADRLARRTDHAREIGLRDAAERDRAALVLGCVLAQLDEQQ